MASVVLHIEDELAHAQLVKRCLERLPIACQIAHVSNGRSALDYLCRLAEYHDPATSPRPALVLLDLNIPKVSGLEVLKKIKFSDELSGIPVVVLTSSGSDEDERIAYENHANDFRTKPIMFDDFTKLFELLAENWLAELPPPSDRQPEIGHT